MLAAINPGAVILGVATGGLTASILSLLVGGGLAVGGVEQGPGIGLVVGILAGLTAGGWVAGRRARHSARFHGSVTGLLLAFVIVLIARIGGSPAPVGSVLVLALLAVIVSGLSGWMAGARRGGG